MHFLSISINSTPSRCYFKHKRRVWPCLISVWLFWDRIPGLTIPEWKWFSKHGNITLLLLYFLPFQFNVGKTTVMDDQHVHFDQKASSCQFEQEWNATDLTHRSDITLLLKYITVRKALLFQERCDVFCTLEIDKVNWSAIFENASLLRCRRSYLDWWK